MSILMIVISLTASAEGEYASMDTVINLDEVSVSAIKQTAVIASFPVASTTISDDQVKRLNIVTMKGISEVVPNFYIPDYGSRMTSSIYVRGLGARIDQPVVGYNVDNVPILNKNNYDFDIMDIERIEMLRGPQSTLYGRNTMGGIINVYTPSPLRRQGIKIHAEYSRANTIKAGVSVLHKFTPRLGMSWSLNYGHTDGYFRNLYNGEKCDKENHGEVRWKTVARISDNVTAENIASFQILRQGGYPYEYIATGEVNYNDTCFYRRSSFIDGLTLRSYIGDIELASITSFQYLDDNMTLDQDFLPLEYFTLTQKSREWALTQDFVGKGKWKSVDWLCGLFGFYKHTSMLAPVTFKPTGIERLILEHVNSSNPNYPHVWDEDSFVLDSDFSNNVWGVAMYHQSTLKLPRWDFTLGLRLDVEKSSLHYENDCETSYSVYYIGGVTPVLYSQCPIEVLQRGDLSHTFVQFIPKVAAMYKLSENDATNNVYASISKGYKAGGFNTQMFSDVLQQEVMGQMGLASMYDVDDIISYKPEVSWNYELGAHLSTLDGSLTGEISLFYIDCRNQQLTVFPDGNTTGRIMTNAGSTRSYGVELSARYRMGDHWELTGAYGHTNARFRHFHNGLEDYSGKYLPYAPRNTLFGGLTYRTDLIRGIVDYLEANVNCRGIGKIMWNEANTYAQPFYAQLGASVTARFNNFSLSLWGENLTNTQYNTFYFVSIKNAFLQRGKPRIFGATLRIEI